MNSAYQKLPKQKGNQNLIRFHLHFNVCPNIEVLLSKSMSGGILRIQGKRGDVFESVNFEDQKLYHPHEGLYSII